MHCFCITPVNLYLHTCAINFFSYCVRDAPYCMYWIRANIPLCGCVPERRHPGAYLQMGGRDGWRLGRGVWASCSGHLITTPAPAACLRLTPSLVFGCIFSDRVGWCAPLVSQVLVSRGPHLSAEHSFVWLGDLNELPKLAGDAVIVFVDSYEVPNSRPTPSGYCSIIGATHL